MQRGGGMSREDSSLLSALLAAEDRGDHQHVLTTPDSDAATAAAPADESSSCDACLSPRSNKKEKGSVTWGAERTLTVPEDGGPSRGVPAPQGDHHSCGSQSGTPLNSKADSVQQQRLRGSSPVAISPSLRGGNGGSSSPRFMTPTKAWAAMSSGEQPRSPSNPPTILFVRSTSPRSQTIEQERKKRSAAGSDGAAADNRSEASGTRPSTPLRSRPASAGRSRAEIAPQQQQQQQQQQQRLRGSSPVAISPSLPGGNGGSSSSVSSQSSSPRFMTPTKAWAAMSSGEQPRSPSNPPTILFVRSTSPCSQTIEQERKKRSAAGSDGAAADNRSEASGTRPSTPLRSRPASAGRSRAEIAPQQQQQRMQRSLSSATSPSISGSDGDLMAALVRSSSVSSMSSMSSSPRFMTPTKAWATMTASTAANSRANSPATVCRSSSNVSCLSGVSAKLRGPDSSSSDPPRNIRSEVIDRLLKYPEKQRDWREAELKKRQEEEAKSLTFSPDLSATSAQNRKLVRSPSMAKKGEERADDSVPGDGEGLSGDVFDRLSRITTASLSADHYVSPPPALPFSGDSLLDDAKLLNVSNIVSDPLVARKRQ